MRSMAYCLFICISSLFLDFGQKKAHLRKYYANVFPGQFSPVSLTSDGQVLLFF